MTTINDASGLPSSHWRQTVSGTQASKPAHTAKSGAPEHVAQLGDHLVPAPVKKVDLGTYQLSLSEIADAQEAHRQALASQQPTSQAEIQAGLQGASWQVLELQRQQRQFEEARLAAAGNKESPNR